MTRAEFETKMGILLIKSEVYVAMTGSEYWRINNVKVRMADHPQPNGYVKDYISTTNYDSMFTIALQLINLKTESEKFALNIVEQHYNIGHAEAITKSNKNAKCVGDYDSVYLSAIVDFEDTFINNLN